MITQKFLKTSSIHVKGLAVGALTFWVTGCSDVKSDTSAQYPDKNAVIQVASSEFMVQSQPFNVQRCLNMGNALEAEYEGAWGYTIQDRHLKAVASAGFDTVRIPIRWDTHTESRAPYTINYEFMERVKEVVGQAQYYGMGVIIDVHHYTDLIENPDREDARFLSIWDQIGTVFRNAPANVYFEILNEPTREISNARLNRLYRDVIPVIRQTNPNRVLIMGGNSWNSVDTLGEVDYPNDPNIVATFHDYGPHEFTHQGAEWTEPKMPFGVRWGSREDKAELLDTYQIAARFDSKFNRPIFVGEFGVINTVPNSQRATWTKARRKAMEQAGYSWCAWDFAGAFSIYDLDREAWKPGMLDALFGP